MLAARLVTTLIAGGTLVCGCSAGVPSANPAMTHETTAANWDSYSYNGWSSFYTPATIVSTPPPTLHKSSTHRSLHLRHDDLDDARSGYTDPRWVRISDSESELFPERRQVLELPQVVYSDDTPTVQTGTIHYYSSFIELDSGLHDDLEATTFIP